MEEIVQVNERNTMIFRDYARDWQVFNAIKEVVQNQADGCSHNGARSIRSKRLNDKGEFDFFYKNEHVGQIRLDENFDSIRFVNKGTLQTQALLMGGTDKANCDTAIGTHGEGSILAALVLLRNGYSVRYTSGGQTWCYFLRDDDFFTDASGEPMECLWVKLEDDPDAEKNKDLVIVDIRGLNSQDWLEYTKKFLWLTPTLQPGKIKTPHGTLLLDPTYEAKFFVKQIFTCQYPKQNKKSTTTGLYFGYDFDDMKLNRDRQGIENLDERHQRTSKTLAWIVDNLNKPSIREHLTAAQETHLEQEFLSLVYQSLKFCSHETYYFRNHIGQEGSKRIWNIWKHEEKLHAKVQPVYPNAQHSNLIHKFYKEHQLPEDLFHYTNVGVSWQSWPMLSKCEYYKTINQSFRDFVTQLEDAELSDAAKSIIEVVLEKVNPFLPAPATIQVVECEFPVSFIDGMKLITSSHVFQNTNAKAILLAQCIEKLPIDLVQFASLQLLA